MSTFMANKGNIVRKWYVVDAAGKPLGHTAVIVADLLRGKRKPTYTPHADCGDNVIVINAAKATLSGKKLEQKMYRTHSGWVGGLKETKYKDMMEKKPELAMRVAVRGMMPRNTVTKDSLKRLHIYAGDTHEQQARSLSSGPRNKEVEEHVSVQEALSVRHRPEKVLCRPRPRLPQRHRLHHHQRPGHRGVFRP